MRMQGLTAKQLGDLHIHNGWIPKHQKGSHITYTKPGNIHIITLCEHRTELCRPMAKRLLKEAGIKYQYN